MSAIQSKIGEILDGFRQGYAQYEETVSLLGSYFETLPPQTHQEFFETLWIQYRSEPISNLNPKRTVHALIVRTWAAFGPADSLPARIFANIDWNNPTQAESWAIVVGGEFAHSLWSYRGRFSEHACISLDSIGVRREKRRAYGGRRVIETHFIYIEPVASEFDRLRRIDGKFDECPLRRRYRIFFRVCKFERV